MGLFDWLFKSKESKIIIREIVAEEVEKAIKSESVKSPENVSNNTFKVNSVKNNKKNKIDKPKQNINLKPEKSKEKKKLDSNWTPENFVVEKEEGKLRFHDLGLPNELLAAISDLDFKYCTPIQATTLPESLKGIDITGKAQTGTGKSAAFLLAVLARMFKDNYKSDKIGNPACLIMAPTRELAIQIESDAKELAKYTDYKIMAVFGGMDYTKQMKKLQSSPVDIVVATPGRLLDYINKKHINLRGVKYLVIDEADRMLDMGFIPDMRKIMRMTEHNTDRQTMFFSATLSSDVKMLAIQWTNNPFQVEIEPDQVTAETVKQSAYIVMNDEKIFVMWNLIKQKNFNKVIVFCNRKDEAGRLRDDLMSYGMTAEVLSGDVAQNKRLRVLDDFTNGKINILVATDVAARGIHVADVGCVFNYTLPDDPEVYVHRIGRTGRAGLEGESICFATEDDAVQLPIIEEFIGKKLEYLYIEDDWEELPKPIRIPRARPKKQFKNTKRKTTRR